MKIQLHWQILIGLVFGVIFGVIFPTTYKITDDTINELEAQKLPNKLIIVLKSQKKEFEETKETFNDNLQQIIDTPEYKEYGNQIIEASKYNLYVPYVSWMGELFIRALKMVIVPLIISSIISGISNIRTNKNLLKIGIKTIFYYFSTSILAILTGLVFVSIIKPGLAYDHSLNTTISHVNLSVVSFSDNIKNIIPTNIFQSFVDGHILSIIFFSLLFGYFITEITEKYSVFLQKLFNAFFEVMIRITGFIIKFTPLGILGIIAVVVSESTDIITTLHNMGKYIFTVLIALFFHSVITLPFILKFAFGVKPFRHFKAMRSTLLTAFSTSSSTVTLPLTMNSVSRKSGVSSKISGLTLPLGTTINMDGTALYELIAVFFIAQIYGVELSVIETVIVVATTLLASIGASAIPMASLVMMSIILSSVGLPIEGIGLIIVADRLLDMFKTLVNVWSDSCGAVIIAKSEGENLKV